MPSDTHEKLKARAIAWLSSRATGRGVRAGTEVRVHAQYVADVVAWADLQGKHDRKFLRHSYKGELPDAHTRPFGPYSWVFECKASRSDFMSTFAFETQHHHRRCHPRANWHICVTTGDFEVDDNLPREWGHLTVCGSGLSIERMPQYCPMAPEDHNHLSWEVMWTQGNKPIRKIARLIQREEHNSEEMETD